MSRSVDYLYDSACAQLQHIFILLHDLHSMTHCLTCSINLFYIRFIEKSLFLSEACCRMKLVRFLKTCSDILKRRVAVVMGVALAHLVHQKIPVPKIVLMHLLLPEELNQLVSR